MGVLSFVKFVIFLSVYLNDVLAIPSIPIRRTREVKDSAVTNHSYRLPNNTKPEVYNLFFETNIDKGDFNFNGEIIIKINVLEETDRITLHQHGLKIYSVKLTSNSGENINIKAPEYDSDREFVTFETVDDWTTLKVGQTVFLAIKYYGTLSNDYFGFYHLSYYDKENDRRWIATTHFEPTFARRAFPCYDEPALKAKFNIQIAHSPIYTAISNMPETARRIEGSYAITRFEQTPLMSPYLVAFVISDFKFREKVNENGFRYRIYASSDKIESTTYALNEANKVQTAISDYLKMNFTMPKMDQIALPDYAPQYFATENWGLIIFNERGLLYDDKNDIQDQKKVVTSIMSHEFSHQWFGNLVTPKWWNYIWLNEGFGTLFESIGTDLVHPDWNTFQDFIHVKMHAAMKYDDHLFAQSKSRPMSCYKENPSELNSLFDEVIYGKSASVLRMLMHAFTEGSFRKGLKYYLTKNSYQSATEVDLFDSLQRAVKEDATLDKEFSVHEIFSSWSNQNGYPLMTVTRNYSDNTIQIAQERCVNKPASSSVSLEYWWIPYNFDTANNIELNDTQPDGWLVSPKIIRPTEQKNWSSSDWVLFNRQQTGFYRVLYDEKNYRMILDDFKSGKIDRVHAFNRAQLIDDLGYFAQTGRLPYTLFFDFLKYVNNGTDANSWIPVITNLIQMECHIEENGKTQRKLHNYAGVKCSDTPYVRSYLVSHYFGASLRRRTMENVGKIACKLDVTLCEPNYEFSLL